MAIASPSRWRPAPSNSQVGRHLRNTATAALDSATREAERTCVVPASLRPRLMEDQYLYATQQALGRALGKNYLAALFLKNKMHWFVENALALGPPIRTRRKPPLSCPVSLPGLPPVSTTWTGGSRVETTTPDTVSGDTSSPGMLKGEIKNEGR
ncbi:hypothetical protein RRG08_009884 [Elysia crispata]|uniref:Uncharacterized protein n=1 Tax=Elysia crispata TaxID=231223 RepID=A0AAE1D9P3_9GAST|nr:hypothetical protein RRG08_009884 [Elysia crispata]